MIALTQLPAPSQRNIALHVTMAAEKAIRDGHPWLFENSILKQSKDGQAGDIAIIFDKRDRFLALGLYDPDSPIRVKILHQNSPAKVNYDFFRDKLSNGIAKREALLATDTNGYRLVYGEGDSLPALIIDRYADVLVMKLYSAAWLPHLKQILAGINELLPDKTIILRLSRLLQNGESFGLADGMVLQGSLPDPSVLFRENGLQFRADVIAGHKTGFFFDQRDNRYRVRQLTQNKSVLDVFSYNGGFSVNAAMGGASTVTSLDISAPALSSAIENMQLNHHHPTIANCQHETLASDAFDSLGKLARNGKTYDMVIVDPPTFASSQKQVEGALIAYEKLVKLALQVLEPKGIFVMASCSNRVPAEKFFALVHNTAMRAGRPLNEIERSQHAIDHPITFPEGAYLKCLFARA